MMGCKRESGENQMNKYICQVCGAVSYSSARPESAISDKCIEDGCEGKVELVKEGVNG